MMNRGGSGPRPHWWASPTLRIFSDSPFTAYTGDSAIVCLFPGFNTSSRTLKATLTSGILEAVLQRQNNRFTQDVV